MGSLRGSVEEEESRLALSPVGYRPAAVRTRGGGK